MNSQFNLESANLKTINDTKLIETTISLVRQERELLTHVLHHLREIDRRRLYCAMGFKSLFEFAVKHLGYPEDQAYRRISAMKLLCEVPELEQKIQDGSISLTHIGLAQTLFRQERKIQNKTLSHAEKLRVFKHIAGKPVREAERITLSMSSEPQKMKPDHVRPMGEDRIELKFTADQKLQGKIEKLKGLLAHKNSNISLGELFDQLCDLALSEWDPSKSASTKTVVRRKSPVTKPPSKAQTRRSVFERAGNACENCRSTYALEVDHIQPQALGGDSNIENLRILCRSCNQRAAITALGQTKMDLYLN